MEGFQKKFQALSVQCLAHEVEDQLTASEIRFSRKQLQEEYDILVNAFEILHDKRACLANSLLHRPLEGDAAAFFKKRLHCISDVVKDQSTPSAIQYTRKHLEEDYNILMHAFMELQETQTHIYMQLSMSGSGEDEVLAESMVLPGDVNNLLIALENQLTRQQLKEDHETLIKAYKDLQEKHAFLLKELSIGKDGDAAVLTDSKKQWHHKHQKGLTTEQDCGSMVSEIKFTSEHLQVEYYNLIRAFQRLRAKEKFLLEEQEKQENLREQYHTECERGLSSEENLKSVASKLKFARLYLKQEYDILIQSFKHLHAKACLLDQQKFILIRQEEDTANTKKQRRDEYERGLSDEEYHTHCGRRVDNTMRHLEADCDKLIKAFKDFRARQTSFLGAQTIRHIKQEKNYAGLKRQYRTEYERGLSKVVKDRLLQAVNPEIERKIELLIKFRKNLQVQAAGWLEELGSRPAEGELDLKQWYYVYSSKKVQLPQDVLPELERNIERLVTAHKNLEAEEARVLEELSSRRCVEEEVQTDSKKQGPSNEAKDWLTQAEVSELERIIELSINAITNLEAEETCLLEELSRRQQTTCGRRGPDPDCIEQSHRGRNPVQVQGGEQVQDLSTGIREMRHSLESAIFI